jgi:hypothetical protein
MPINVIWENDAKTLVRLDISGKWGWVELRRAVEQVIAETGDQPYHCIMNYVAGVSVPVDLLSIGRQTTTIIPPSLRTVVSVIGRNMLLKTLGDAYHTFYGNRQRSIRFFTVMTLQDAYLVLENEGIIADSRLHADQDAS